MNFFQHQDVARKKTTQLVILLFVAVLSLIAITVFAVAVFVYFFQTYSDSATMAHTYSQSFGTHFFHLLNSTLILYVSVGVISVVGLGSLFKTFQLGKGGKIVAESLGGKLISQGTQDQEERRLLNVVEEMAIASGNPVPQVYILDEESINAFAAGKNRRDAVIGVTRGCIQLLNRDELQGVMAHEFSHIHNGDMRLNMRLVAILHGILVIGLIGYFILRGSTTTRRGKNAGNQAILGLTLVAIGYTGTFFGNVIKSAVSRQREFLADASAVQFTRNPDGISGALKKIGGYTQGSELKSGAASEYSHMYFGQGIKTALNGLMATHPPLSQRIQRIKPDWKTDSQSPHHTHNTEHFSTDAASGFSAGEYTNDSTNTIKEQIINSIGAPQPKHHKYAKDFLSQLPSILKNAAHETYSARALIYCLLLDTSNTVRKNQLTALKDQSHPATFSVIQKIYESLNQRHRQNRISILELCIPALKQMSAPQYQVFKKNLVRLIQTDKKITLFEWCLYRIVTHTLEKRTTKEDKTLRQVKPAIETLLSIVAQIGENQNPTKAFNAGVNELDQRIRSYKYLTNGLNYSKIDKALNLLNRLKPLEKPKLLKALLATIIFDKRITQNEIELFRAVAESLDCPTPPMPPVN